MLNLSHRRSHERPEALEAGRHETVEVVLDAIGYRLPPGHRLRMAVSSGYWPMMWPAPAPVCLSVHIGTATSLELPVRAAPDDAERPPDHFGQPERQRSSRTTSSPLEVPRVSTASRETPAQARTSSSPAREAATCASSTRDSIRRARSGRSIVWPTATSLASVRCEQSHMIGRGPGKPESTPRARWRRRRRSSSSRTSSTPTKGRAGVLQGLADAHSSRPRLTDDVRRSASPASHRAMTSRSFALKPSARDAKRAVSISSKRWYSAPGIRSALLS